jgi:hypothetical protein
MVYFMWDRTHELLKIGGTGQPLRMRLNAYGTKREPSTLFLGVMEGRFQSEFNLQQYVACLTDRVRNSDWFRPNKRLAEFVNSFVLSPLFFDWRAGSSDDDSPWAVKLTYAIEPNCRRQWLQRLADHVGKTWNEIPGEALKFYVASVGFTEPMPAFPTSKRKKPLVRVDRKGKWWILRESGKYIPGFIPEQTERQ